jgi:hypothetical protein
MRWYYRIANREPVMTDDFVAETVTLVRLLIV